MISHEELDNWIEHLEVYEGAFDNVILALQELKERRKSPQFPTSRPDYYDYREIYVAE